MASHCHDEQDGHSHADGHDHSDDITPALQYSLYQHINFDGITTLNEADPHSGKAITKKTWAERLQEQPELESDADEQLLMQIPYAMYALNSPTNVTNIVTQLHGSSQTPLDPRPHIKLLISTSNIEGVHQS
jgi:hypothetical protein